MDPCKWCGLSVKDGDTHGDQSIREDGTISIKCRTTATLNAELWHSTYYRTVDMPNQKIYFSKLHDPNEW